MASCTSTPTHEPYKIYTFEDNPYVAEVWWGDDYDFEASTTFFKNRQLNLKSGCSSWRKDNFHGRNIDWMMQPYVSMIIHLPKGKDVKYASVGITAGSNVINKEFIDNNEYIPEDMRYFVPSMIVDGINEMGVVINHNIVPYDTVDAPEYEQNGDFGSYQICRFVLDNCATAAEAVELLTDKKITQSVVKLANDYSHFQISDPTSSYVLEWINNEFVATEFKDNDGDGIYTSANNQPAIMTNYFVGQAEKYGLATNDFFKAHRCGAGIERAQIINEALPSAKTVEDHFNICRSVWYSQFCSGKTDWISENAGSYGYDEAKDKAYWEYNGKTHWMDNDDVYAAAKELFACDEFQTYYSDFLNGNNEVKEGNSYWFTQHSVVYDIDAKKGYIIAQEGAYSNEPIEFTVE